MGRTDAAPLRAEAFSTGRVSWQCFFFGFTEFVAFFFGFKVVQGRSDERPVRLLPAAAGRSGSLRADWLPRRRRPPADLVGGGCSRRRKARRVASGSGPASLASPLARLSDQSGTVGPGRPPGAVGRRRRRATRPPPPPRSLQSFISKKKQQKQKKKALGGRRLNGRGQLIGGWCVMTSFLRRPLVSACRTKVIGR